MMVEGALARAMRVPSLNIRASRVTYERVDAAHQTAQRRRVNNIREQGRRGTENMEYRTRCDSIKDMDVTETDVGNDPHDAVCLDLISMQPRAS